MDTIEAQILVRRDSAMNWQNQNPVLAAGELGMVSETRDLRVGDGVTRWNSLTSPWQTKRSDVVYLSDFLDPSRTAGTTDDTSAVKAAVAAAAGKTLVLGNNIIRITKNVEITASGSTIDASGATINCVDDGTAIGVGFFIHDCTGFAWLGGAFRQSAASRTGLYGILRVERVVGGLFDTVSIDGGSSTGIFVAQGSQLTFRNPTVKNTKADGIHLSRGVTDVWVVSPYIDSVGDDGIGIVAVIAEPSGTGSSYPQVKRVIISDPIIKNVGPVGGGVSFVGVADCSLRGGMIDTTPAGGVKITKDSPAGATLNASNVVVTGTIVRNCQVGFSLGDADDCQLNGVQALASADSGIFIVNATRLLVSGGKMRGNASFGVYESAGSGNALIGVDLRGNGSPSQVSSATLTSCLTT